MHPNLSSVTDIAVVPGAGSEPFAVSVHEPGGRARGVELAQPGRRVPDARKGSHPVEIRIGIANAGRELSFESNEPVAEVTKAVADALEKGASHLSFTDAKGNSYIGPTDGLAYVEVGNEEARRVGFVG